MLYICSLPLGVKLTVKGSAHYRNATATFDIDLTSVSLVEFDQYVYWTSFTTTPSKIPLPLFWLRVQSYLIFAVWKAPRVNHRSHLDVAIVRRLESLLGPLHTSNSPAKQTYQLRQILLPVATDLSLVSNRSNRPANTYRVYRGGIMHSGELARMDLLILVCMKFV